MKSVLKNLLSPGLAGQHGTIIILTAILLTVFAGMAALAVDLSHLYVVRNELQNAADAGALAGAWALYDDTGNIINIGANQEAYDAATANKAISTKGTISVDVDWDETKEDDNTHDVQRGHWSFGRGDLPKGFKGNNSLAPPILWDKSPEKLDDNLEFINAVKVVTRRDKTVDEGTSAASFFANFFGFDDFILKAEAVAYLGFAGSLEPNDVDLPIALCQQSLINENGQYTCSFGRMLNSGSKPGDHNTGGWTNFKQDVDKEQCSTANTPDLRDILDGCSGNPRSIVFGLPIGTTGGVVDNVINHPSGKANITSCWKAGLYDTNDDGIPDASVDRDSDNTPDMPWSVTLPVIDCPGNQPGSCGGTNPAIVVGSVTVNVVWILEKENDIDADAPEKMADWPDLAEEAEIANEITNGKSPGEARWDSFVKHFGLMLPTGDDTFDLATVANDGFKKKSIYFLPDCTYHKPGGLTGGANFGILADIPVLVE